MRVRHSTLWATVTAVLATATIGTGALKAAGVPGTQAAPQAAGATKAASSAGVKRGEYLVRLIACNDCHTPLKMGPNGPEPDRAAFLAGHPSAMALPPAPGPTGPWLWHGAATNTAFAGPWGVTFAANLTPDKETGLGDWTEAQFIATMRTGRHQGKGRQILPPMPIEALKGATDADLRDIFSYLRTLPPVANKVPSVIEPSEGTR